jgi:hypothetical protein
MLQSQHQSPAVKSKMGPSRLRMQSRCSRCLISACYVAHSNHLRLSREEREELYKLARERIFGNSEGSIPGEQRRPLGTTLQLHANKALSSENDGEIGVSRTSSISASNKAGNVKRGKPAKQRRDDSDSFDSRNQYTAYWGPQQQTWVPQSQGQYIPPATGQFAPPPQSPYAAQGPQAPPGPPAYNQTTAGYANMPVMAPPAPAYAGFGMSQVCDLTLKMALGSISR